MKYQPWYALGELVDNAIQSHLSNIDALREIDPGHVLEVSIEIDRAENGRITVSDNAAGISAADWGRAFKVAEPPSDASGLSQFGVGMKAACCWFARRWSVDTIALGAAEARAVTFDVPRIIESRDEQLEVEVRYADVRAHGTRVEMTDLYRPVAARTLGKIKEYLGGIYRQFLRRGDLVLTVNGEPLLYDEPPILKAPLYNDRGGEAHRWRQDVDLVLDSGRRVHGFVGIRETGASKSAGLALFYRGKVVTGSGEEFYKPVEIFGGGNTFASQRVFGELHMDDFSVTYTKDALVWYDEEEEFVAALRDALDREPWPLLRQANNFRKRDPELAGGESVSSALANIVSAFTDVEFELDPATSDDTWSEAPAGFAHLVEPLPLAPPEGRASASPPVDRSIEVSVRGTTWKVDLRLVADDKVSRWLTVFRTKDDQLTLTVNQSHPFMRAWCELPGQELEPVWRVAIALGLGQEMARMQGAHQPGLVTQNVNEVLRTVMSRKN
ncbi:ATP-binding protein [Nocardioides marmotae]|nr:ATP-binding protein [Nocardioides marmotae]